MQPSYDGVSHGDRHAPRCTCRAHALPPALRVRDARDAYLAENGFSTAGYDSPRSEGSLFGFKFSVPNPPVHQRALRLHDLHHVATGFGTDHAGEAEISVWQVRRGLRGGGLYVASIVLGNALLGLAVAPLRTLAAAQLSRHGGSLLDVTIDYESLLALTVFELRQLLGIPVQGLNPGTRGLHAHAPAQRESRPG
jgi:hypothetical protein